MFLRSISRNSSDQTAAQPVIMIIEAGWQSGHAADCNSVYAGSIPTPASISDNETSSVSLWNGIDTLPSWVVNFPLLYRFIPFVLLNYCTSSFWISFTYPHHSIRLIADVSSCPMLFNRILPSVKYIAEQPVSLCFLRIKVDLDLKYDKLCASLRGHGGIGRHRRLKISCLRACRFESGWPHQIVSISRAPNRAAPRFKSAASSHDGAALFLYTKFINQPAPTRLP